MEGYEIAGAAGAMSEAPAKLPSWVDLVLIPLINLAMALAVSGLIVLAIGESPLEALKVMLTGAFGYDQALGYTLYYTTNFIFTGLAVAVAFHAGCSISAAKGRPISAAWVLGWLAWRSIRACRSS